MAENYAAIALGRDSFGNRVYGLYFPLFDNVMSEEELSDGAETGLFDIKYRGPSLTEAENSLKNLRKISTKELPDILIKAVKDKLAEIL